MKFINCFLIAFVCLISNAQNYVFEPIKSIESLPVISQDNTGTCWSYATSSFLESEIIRIKGTKIDLSEMFQVRNTYLKKAENYIMRQGGAQFSEGALAHDVINSAKEFGLIPADAYKGLNANEQKHNHAELVAILQALVKTYVTKPEKILSPKWRVVIENVLDIYLGKVPTEFVFEGKKYTAKSFLNISKIEPSNYITLTSFLHEPLYKNFILNIPDNFSNGGMYNISLDEFESAVKQAIEKGYTIALDCDVSEETFSGKYGIAFIPNQSEDTKKGLAEIIEEKIITAEYRQQEFENQNTTDDHLMHIIGMVKDQNGTIYYKVKNSWGTDEKKIGNNGYIYMSSAYFRLKSISILLHKNALSKELLQSLKL